MKLGGKSKRENKKQVQISSARRTKLFAVEKRDKIKKMVAARL